jgi:DNA polymerase III subunit alpha
VACNALSRPGAANMIGRYISNKNKSSLINNYGSKIYEEVTKHSYGLCLFQEQIMQLGKYIGGFDAKQLSILTKGVKTTNILEAKESFEKVRDPWFENCRNTGVSEFVASELWDLICGMAGYGFNKSQSVGYSMLSFQTAYLKRHYPAEWIAACMITCPDEIDSFVAEAKKARLEILPPDINVSDLSFTFVNGSVYYGLMNISHLGEIAAQKIIEGRPFKTKEEWEAWQEDNKSKVNKRVVEGLTESGALMSLGIAPSIPNRSEREKKWLGTVVGDPTEEWKEQIDAVMLNPINEQSIKEVCTVGVSRTVEVAGVIDRVKNLIDRKNKPMAFFDMSYKGYSFNCAAFSSVYGKFQDIISVGEVVFVRGEMSSKDGKISVAYMASAAEHWSDENVRKSPEILVAGTSGNNMAPSSTLVPMSTL